MDNLNMSWSKWFRIPRATLQMNKAASNNAVSIAIWYSHSCLLFCIYLGKLFRIPKVTSRWSKQPAWNQCPQGRHATSSPRLWAFSYGHSCSFSAPANPMRLRSAYKSPCRIYAQQMNVARIYLNAIGSIANVNCPLQGRLCKSYIWFPFDFTHRKYKSITRRLELVKLQGTQQVWSRTQICSRNVRKKKLPPLNSYALSLHLICGLYSRQ